MSPDPQPAEEKKPANRVAVLPTDPSLPSFLPAIRRFWGWPVVPNGATSGAFRHGV